MATPPKYLAAQLASDQYQAPPAYLAAPTPQDQYQAPSFMSRLGQGIANVPADSWFSLAQALASTPNVGQGFAMGLSGFGKAYEDNKKKQGMAQMLQGMGDNIPEAQRPLFQLLAKEDPSTLVNGLASQMFTKPPEPTSTIQNYLFAKQQGYQGSLFDYQASLAKMGATGQQTVDVPGVGAVVPGTGAVVPSAPPASAPAAPRPSRGAPIPPPASVIPPDSPGQYFDPSKHPELGDGMSPPPLNAADFPPSGAPAPAAVPAATPPADAKPAYRPILDAVAKQLNLGAPPQGQVWTYGEDGITPTLQSVPGYKPSQGQMPAELAAKLGLAEGFLKRYETIDKDLSQLQSLGGRIEGKLNTGRPGEIKRQIKSGAEALVRILTGAGKSESEAQDQVSQYLPDEFDTAFTLKSKLKGLKYDLENSIGAVMKPYGGWQSPAKEYNPGIPLPKSPVELKNDGKTVYQTSQGPAYYIGNGKFKSAE